MNQRQHLNLPSEIASLGYLTDLTAISRGSCSVTDSSQVSYLHGVSRSICSGDLYLYLRNARTPNFWIFESHQGLPHTSSYVFGSLPAVERSSVKIATNHLRQCRRLLTRTVTRLKDHSLEHLSQLFLVPQIQDPKRCQYSIQTG